MLQINGLSEGLEIFRTLGSEVRMNIVELLARNEKMNMNEIASSLGLTNGALTTHIKMLEECGLIRCSTEHSGRGLQKMCSLNVDQILLNVFPAVEERTTKVYETEIRVGHYSDYKVTAGCGLIGPERMIGNKDDPRAFAYPERVEAEMLWLHDGYVEFRIPNLLPEGQRIVQLTLSFEISSADHGGNNDRLSRIRFSLNGREMGEWVSVRASDSSRGIYTPSWWNGSERQHGFLKMLVINDMGVFLDGKCILETDNNGKYLDSFGEMKFRIESHPEEGLEGGLALYGKGFGNFRQNILARVHYMPEA